MSSTLTASPSLSKPPWWQSAVFYQVYLRSFQDSNADGVGDLPGLLERLSYIADLGVDGLWIGPFYPSPMRDMGYDVTDHQAVDPRFGTLDDFDRVLQKAHRLGLKVITDQVWSHTAQEHPWFQESCVQRHGSKADWYVWADPKPDGSPPNNWQSWMGGPAWRWEPRRKQYLLHNFLPTMPDLNLHCPEVQDALLEVGRFWLDRGVDGFRLDTANLYAHDPSLKDNPALPVHEHGDSPVLMQDPLGTMNRPESLAFVRRIRTLLNAYPERMAVGEIGGRDAIRSMRTYTQGTEHLHTAYSFTFLGARPTATEIQQHLQPWQDGDAWPSWAFSNHDVPRVATRWATHGLSTDRVRSEARIWMGLLMAMRGTLFIYQGEELGLPEGQVPPDRRQDPFGLAHGAAMVGRDGCRTPMPWQSQGPSAGFSAGHPWLPCDETQARMAVDIQQSDPHSMWYQTRQLIALRRQLPELRQAPVQVLWAQDCTLILRRGPGDRGAQALWCCFHWGPSEVYVPSEALCLPEGTSQWTALWGEPLELGPRGLRLPPCTAAYLKPEIPPRR